MTTETTNYSLTDNSTDFHYTSIGNNTPELIADSVAHKDEVTSRLMATVDEFLEFSSTNHLIRLLADVL